MRKTLFGFGLVALVAGCQAPLSLTPAPLAAEGSVTTVASAQGQVAVTIRWPYRAQVIPTSTERLRFTLSGPSSQTFTLDRPAGSGPTSTASLQVDVGTGYTLGIEAFAKASPSDFDPTLLVASGQSASFDVLANKIASVKVTLEAQFVPQITDFSPTNGGPGTYVTFTGANFALSGSQFRFGGTPAISVFVQEAGTASALVPEGATTSPVVPVADGVTGIASGSFTVLSALGVLPLSQSVASGSTYLFTAEATTTEGAAFPAPTVQWLLSTNSIGTIAPNGLFTATGTGSGEVKIVSGRLVATASVTVP